MVKAQLQRGGRAWEAKEREKAFQNKPRDFRAWAAFRNEDVLTLHERTMRLTFDQVCWRIVYRPSEVEQRQAYVAQARAAASAHELIWTPTRKPPYLTLRRRRLST